MNRKYIVAVTIVAFVVMAFAGIVQAKPGKGKPEEPKQGFKEKAPRQEAKFQRQDQETVASTVYQTVYGQVYAKTPNANKPVKSLEGLVAVLKASGKTISGQTAVKGKKLKKVSDQNKAWLQVAVANGLLSAKDLKKFNPNQPMKLKDLKRYLSKLGINVEVPPPTMFKPVDSQTVTGTVYNQTVAETVYSQTVAGSVYAKPTRVQNPNSPVTWAQLNAVLAKIKK
ncbi:MAG: hypothetical protein ACM3QW_04095 [Ignavibacteriales bacterium]